VPVPTTNKSSGHKDKRHKVKGGAPSATAESSSSSSTAIKPKRLLRTRHTTPPQAPGLASPAVSPLPPSFAMAVAYAKDQRSRAPTAPTSAAAPAPAPAVAALAARASEALLPVPGRSVHSPQQDKREKLLELVEPLHKYLQTNPEPEIGGIGIFDVADLFGTKGKSILTAFFFEEDGGGFECTICGDTQTEDGDALEHQRKRHFTKEGTGTGNGSI